MRAMIRSNCLDWLQNVIKLEKDQSEILWEDVESRFENPIRNNLPTAYPTVAGNTFEQHMEALYQAKELPEPVILFQLTQDTWVKLAQFVRKATMQIPHASQILGKRVRGEAVLDELADDKTGRGAGLTISRNFPLVCALESSSGVQLDKVTTVVGTVNKVTDNEEGEHMLLSDIDSGDWKGSLSDYLILDDVDTDNIYRYDKDRKKIRVSDEKSFLRALKYMHHVKDKEFRFFVTKTGKNVFLGLP